MEPCDLQCAALIVALTFLNLHSLARSVVHMTPTMPKRSLALHGLQLHAELALHEMQRILQDACRQNLQVQHAPLLCRHLLVQCLARQVPLNHCLRDFASITLGCARTSTCSIFEFQHVRYLNLCMLTLAGCTSLGRTVCAAVAELPPKLGWVLI